MCTQGLSSANCNNIKALKDITLGGASGAPFAFMNGVGQLTDATFAVTWESR
jgi:hypothetical protein